MTSPGTRWRLYKDDGSCTTESYGSVPTTRLLVSLTIPFAAGHVSRSTMHHAWLLQARVEKLTHLLDQCQVTDDPLATAAGEPRPWTSGEEEHSADG